MAKEIKDDLGALRCKYLEIKQYKTYGMIYFSCWCKLNKCKCGDELYENCKYEVKNG